jgi:hypothetical protein
MFQGKMLFSLFMCLFLGLLNNGNVLCNMENGHYGTIEVKQIAEEQFNEIDNGGTITKVNYDNRTAYVYLPYGYNEETPYRVMYFMHGGCKNCPDSANDIFEKGNMKPVLDNLIANGEIEPFIFVSLSWAPDATPQDFADNSVLPMLKFIESSFSTYAFGDVSEENLYNTRYSRYFGGFSNGAYCTWMLLRNENYKYFSCFYPISAYGAYDFEYPTDTIDNIDENFILLDFIGEYENGVGGTSLWKERTSLYEEYTGDGHIYLQGYGEKHNHSMEACVDYLNTCILFFFS